VKRREFGGAVVAWPLVARAQQPDRMRGIGVLMNLSVDDPEAPSRVAAFAQGLGELGWNIGRNVWIDYRWGGGGSGAAFFHKRVRDASEIEHAVAAFARSSNAGLIVTPSPYTAPQRNLIIALAARHNLPAVYYERYVVAAGRGFLPLIRDRECRQEWGGGG
jgi:hypothetical protein